VSPLLRHNIIERFIKSLTRSKEMKKLLSLLMIPALALGLGSCRDMSKDFCKKGNYNGYDVKVSFDERGKAVRISNGNVYLIAIGDTNRTYFKEIGLDKEMSAQEISEFESEQLSKYGDQDSLNKIYNQILETGCDCRGQK